MTDADPKFLRRRAAAKYLKNRYGFTTEKTLSKLASTGGGPVFRKAGSVVLYDVRDLDDWAESRLSGPMRSTSEAGPAA